MADELFDSRLVEGFRDPAEMEYWLRSVQPWYYRIAEQCLSHVAHTLWCASTSLLTLTRIRTLIIKAN